MEADGRMDDSKALVSIIAMLLLLLSESVVFGPKVRTNFMTSLLEPVVLCAPPPPPPPPLLPLPP